MTKTAFLLVCVLLLSTLAACGKSADAVAAVAEQLESSTGNEVASASIEVDSMAGAVVENDTGNRGAGADLAPDMITENAVEDSGAASVAEAIAENSEDHDGAKDCIWDDQVVQITLKGDSITVDGDGVTVDGSQAIITSAGTYNIRGTLADGQIIVDTDDKDIVRLVLNGVDMSHSTSAPIYVTSAEKTVIVLADHTENYVSDGASYVFEDPEEDEPNAAVFAKSDLTICGNGTLTVNGNYNDGIASKDGLVITSGTLTVGAVDDGIRGKDYLVLKGGNITVGAQGDGLKSDNETDAAKGYISIETGVINITSGGNAIQAATDVMITDGDITLSSGGGSNGLVDESTSAKGIKAVVNLNIDGGTFDIDSADDAIRSNGSIVINDGTFVIASGDDGMHADATWEINAGELNITKSYEGIESAVININDGDIHIVSSDDGLNVAGGMDGSGMNWGPGQGGGMNQGGGFDQDGDPDPGGRPGRGGGQGGMPGQDGLAYSGNYHLYINGGYIVIEAAGDGIDANGAIDMTGGVVLVHGPTQNMNGALDYMGSFNISGGLLVAAGSAGMAQAPSTSSTQCSMLLNLNGTLQAGTLVHIQSSDGQEVLTFAPTKQYQSIVFSSSELVDGATYDVYYGGSSTGTVHDGL